MEDHSHLTGGGVGKQEALINTEDPKSQSGEQLLSKMKEISLLIEKVNIFLFILLLYREL